MLFLNKDNEPMSYSKTFKTNNLVDFQCLNVIIITCSVV